MDMGRIIQVKGKSVGSQYRVSMSHCKELVLGVGKD